MTVSYLLTERKNMQTEIEAKFLDIDIEKLREKLRTAGAALTHPERMMTREVFHLSDNYYSGVWLRVRDEGDKVTMSYKQLEDRSLHGTKEITLEVNDFKKACEFLLALGLHNYSYQETKRERWNLKGVEITIDTWPWIPTFVELEAPAEMQLKETAAALGLPWRDAMHGSVETAYQKYYDVTEKDVDSWKQITFTPVPEWLESKRRK